MLPRVPTFGVWVGHLYGPVTIAGEALESGLFS